MERDIFRRRQVAHRWDQALQDWICLIPAMLARPVEEGAELTQVLSDCPLPAAAGFKIAPPKEHLSVRRNIRLVLIRAKEAGKVCQCAGVCLDGAR